MDERLSPARWIGALNALLPPAIRVIRSRYVSNQFHARFSAKGKVYRYRIWSGLVLPPLEYKRAWHIATPLDFALLKQAAKPFVGTHDFAQFAANRGKTEEDSFRTIYSARVRRHGPCLTIDVDGSGFLYRMVRLMVGSLVQCATGKFDLEEITGRLGSNHRTRARLAAPAEGLFLIRVRY